MENSKILLEQTIKILHSSNLLENRWAIGGGTVLGMYFNHRMSHDIDVFLDDPQYLSVLSPRLNDEIEEALRYVEDSRFISLTFPAGKIDFIICPQITDFISRERLFFGHKIRLEHPVEIVSKKIYFRGNRVYPRDIFDLATVYNSAERKNLIASLQKMPDKVDEFYQGLTDRFKDKTYLPYSKENGDMILPGGKSLIGKEFQLCKDLLCKINAKYREQVIYR